MANVIRKITLTDFNEGSGPNYKVEWSTNNITYSESIDCGNILLNNVGSFVTCSIDEDATSLRLTSLNIFCSNSVEENIGPPPAPISGAYQLELKIDNRTSASIDSASIQFNFVDLPNQRQAGSLPNHFFYITASGVPVGESTFTTKMNFTGSLPTGRIMQVLADPDLASSVVRYNFSGSLYKDGVILTSASVMSDNWSHQLSADFYFNPVTWATMSYELTASLTSSTPPPPTSSLCVSSFGASMAPCAPATEDDHMEGFIFLSGNTSVDAEFTLQVGYLPGVVGGNCNNTNTFIDLLVTVPSGSDQGFLDCNNGAPFIDINGATICSITITNGPYPLCASTYCYELETVQSAPGECFDCPGNFASVTDTLITFFSGCSGSLILPPFDINVESRYSDNSTGSLFIPAGATGSLLIATSDIQCAPLPACGEITSPTFLSASVIPVTGSYLGTLDECCAPS